MRARVRHQQPQSPRPSGATPARRCEQGREPGQPASERREPGSGFGVALPQPGACQGFGRGRSGACSARLSSGQPSRARGAARPQLRGLQRPRPARGCRIGGDARAGCGRSAGVRAHCQRAVRDPPSGRSGQMVEPAPARESQPPVPPPLRLQPQSRRRPRLPIAKRGCHRRRMPRPVAAVSPACPRQSSRRRLPCAVAAPGPSGRRPRRSRPLFQPL